MLKYAKFFAYNELDDSDLSFQKQLLAIIWGFLLLCGCVWTVMYYSVYGISIPFYAALGFAINAIVSALIAHRTKNILYLVYPLFIACSVSPFIMHWSAGSINEGAMVIIWGFLTPLGILIFTSLRPAIIAMIGFVILILITINLQPKLGPPIKAGDDLANFLFSMNIAVSLTVNFICSAWFVYQIKVAKQNSERLLLNILPADVAEELKAHGKVEPVNHELTTVLFTDFKGFTEITETIRPKELVAEINYCFAAFDAITTKYNIEKIKTIGDSYMAVGANFNEDSECSPWHVVSAGLEMLEFVKIRKKERDAEGKFGFEMRAGAHTGPIISGVVGVKKFQFDIWGDTVNSASRMESHGETNQLNISGVTYELIKDKFDCEFRGSLPVKGKKDMDMYFVKHKSK